MCYRRMSCRGFFTRESELLHVLLRDDVAYYESSTYAMCMKGTVIKTACYVLSSLNVSSILETN